MLLASLPDILPLKQSFKHFLACMALLFKVKFDGTIFTYDYHVRVAYVTTFDHPQTQNFYLQHPRTMCLTNVVGLNYMTRSVMKS